MRSASFVVAVTALAILVVVVPTRAYAQLTASDLLTPGSLYGKPIPHIRWECPNNIQIGFEDPNDQQAYQLCFINSLGDWAATNSHVTVTSGQNMRFVPSQSLGRATLYLTDYGFIKPDFVIRFDNSKAWLCGCLAGYWDLETTMFHEIGHVLGLNLDDYNSAVANASWGQTVMHQPQAQADCITILGTLDGPAVNLLYANVTPNCQGVVSTDLAAFQTSCVCGTSNPAARILGFAYRNGRAEWDVLYEHDTYRYFVEGCQTPNGKGVILADYAPHAGAHRVPLDAEDHAYLRLVEVEKSGRRLVHDVTPTYRPTAQSRRNRPEVDRISLANSVRRLSRGYRVERADAAAPFTYVVFTVEPYISLVRVFVEDYWEARGEKVAVVDLTPYTPLARQQLIVDLIEFYNSSDNTLYFHIVGDDGELFESSFWSASSYWQEMKAAYEERGASPEKPVPETLRIPTLRLPDYELEERNTAQSQPYLTTDQPYADLNSDGVPDVVVTRWPVSDTLDVIFAAEKMRRHNDTYAFGEKNATFFVGDVNRQGAGDGAMAISMAEQVENELLQHDSGELISYLLETDEPDDSIRVDIAADLLNETTPEIAVVFGTSSTPHAPGLFFSNDYSYPAYELEMADLVAGNIIPVVVAASCHGAQWSADNPVFGRPTCEDFLFQLDSRGAVAYTGPTGGTWQDGNYVLARLFVKELFSHPTRPMGESWLLALQRAYAIFVDHPEFIDTIASYVFLGDPLSPFRPTPSATITTKVEKPDTTLGSPESIAVGCPQGDQDRIVVTVQVDSTGLAEPIPAGALTISQPAGSTVVFYSATADSALTLVGDTFRTTFTVSSFGGCGLDSAEVRLYNLPIGWAHINVRSPDHFFGDPGQSTWGEVYSDDFGFFGEHFNSSPCNCIYSQPYDECANLVPSADDTLIVNEDFTMFGNHWQHSLGGGGQSVSPRLAYSSGLVELEFEEDRPLQGARKLRASVTLVGVEPYRSLVVVLRNENSILRFAGWHSNPDYDHPTMAATVDRRTGSPEIVLGFIGGRDTDNREVHLGYVEMGVLSTEPLELSERDLELVDARLAAFDGGTFAFASSQVGRIEQPVELRYGLAQNYPNPFNPTTTISYSIARPSRVQLDIFNVRGQLVQTLVDEEQIPNVYRKVWDGRNSSGNSVASGIYFYRLTAGEFRSTRKMVLIR